MWVSTSNTSVICLHYKQRGKDVQLDKVSNRDELVRILSSGNPFDNIVHVVSMSDKVIQSIDLLTIPESLFNETCLVVSRQVIEKLRTQIKELYIPVDPNVSKLLDLTRPIITEELSGWLNTYIGLPYKINGEVMRIWTIYNEVLDKSRQVSPEDMGIEPNGLHGTALTWASRIGTSRGVEILSLSNSGSLIWVLFVGSPSKPGILYTYYDKRPKLLIALDLISPLMGSGRMKVETAYVIFNHWLLSGGSISELEELIK